MNPFLVSFTLMGFIYILIGVWAVVIGSVGSVAICACGLLVCGLGWSLSNRLLN